MNNDDLIFSNLGGIQSPEDYRDIPFAAVMPIPPKLPDSCFMDITGLPRWNQRKIGACVGHAWAKTKQQVEQKETNSIIPFSARFLYAMAKCQDGIVAEGTYPRMVAKILQNTGCATETTVPNDTTLDHEAYVYNRSIAAIPASALTEAQAYKIKSYAFVGNSEQELKHAIAQAQQTNGEIVMLVEVGKEWWTGADGVPSWDKEKILPVEPPWKVVSGHEVYPYGYETENGRLKVWFLNSWSENWGDNGSGYFYYDEYNSFIKEIMIATDLPDDWVNHVKNLPSPADFRHSFILKIQYGQTSNEVRNLQVALKIDHCFPQDQQVTGYYGDITAKAVKLFQYKHQIAGAQEIEALGGRVIGPKTRTVLTALFG